MTVRKEILITGDEMNDAVAAVNEIVKVVASVGMKHGLDWRVGSAMFIAALEIVEAGHDTCECDGCAETVGRIAARLRENWEAVLNDQPIRGVH